MFRPDRVIIRLIKITNVIHNSLPFTYFYKLDDNPVGSKHIAVFFFSFRRGFMVTHI
jgi:hypothetical protein